MTASVPFCRVNGFYSHYPFEQAAPESFRPLKEQVKNRGDELEWRTVRHKTPFPIQLSTMLVRADALPGLHACIERMRKRDDLVSATDTLQLKRPALARSEEGPMKLTTGELPLKLAVDVAIIAADKPLKALQKLLASKPAADVLPEVVCKSIFMQAWLAESRLHKVKDKPVWMDVRGAVLTEHDAVVVYGADMLQACEEIVGVRKRSRW